MRYLAVIPAWYAIFSIYEAIALQSYESGKATIALLILSGAMHVLSTHLRTNEYCDSVGVKRRSLRFATAAWVMSLSGIALSLFVLSKAQVEFGVMAYMLGGIFGFLDGRTELDAKMREKGIELPKIEP